MNDEAPETNLTTGETKQVPTPTEESFGLYPPGTDLVHLPTVIANEFGISRSVAREQIMLGTVTIDAKPWQGDKIDIPLKVLVGRELVVTGRARVFRMIYEVPGYGR